MRQRGIGTPARAYDALIAAVAVANGLPLFTTNPDEYRGISQLTLVAVPHPDQR
ncbi:MAG: hypothetical protein J4G00_09525 [Actinomycetia bacterium]|nr:hypothetical protein [Actinomycetes bacterium]